MNGYLTLESVIHAENFFISKLSRRRRAHSNFKRMLRLNERILLPRVNEWLDWTIKQIQPGLAKMKGRTAAAKVKSIADWDKIRAEGVVILKPSLHEILTVGGNHVMNKALIRKQDRFDPIGVEAIAWANQHSAELVVEVTDKTIKGIRSYVVAGIKAGKSVPVIARELRPLVGLTERKINAVANFHERLILDRPELTAARQREMTETYARRLHRDRAQTIARTETSFALNEGQRQGYDQMGITHLERVEDQTDPADPCTGTNGRIYTIEEAEGVLPEHPNCLLGDSLVLPGGKITTISKRLYDGKVIIIETASKRKLTCTPGHPILSDGGFCSADSLNIGGYVVSDGLGQGESFEDWKYINKPASIQKIVESFLENRKMMRREMPVTAPDFHGDGKGSEVCIVSSNRFLLNRFNTSFKQHLLNFQFKRGKIRRALFNCFSMFAFPFPRNGFPSDGIVRSFDLRFPLRWRHVLPRLFSNFAFSSNLNIPGLQSLNNRVSGNIILRSNLVQRGSRKIKVDNIINGKVNVSKPALTIPNTFLDKIIQIETSNYKGYIYNLETTESYYIANGIASHNCEGTWVAAPEDLEPKPAEPTKPVKPTVPGEPAKWKPAKSIGEAEKWGAQYGIEGVTAEGKKLTLKEWNIINREMSKLPDDLLRSIKANGGKMDLVVDSGITVHPKYKYLEGQTPRGWEGTGKTWDDIVGAGGTRADPKSIIVANKTTVGHGSVNVTLHEYAHTVDAIAKKGFTNLSESAKWQKIWKGNNSKGVIRTPYQAGYAEEYWAESFAQYFNSPGHGDLPKNVNTYFRNLFEGGT